MRLHEILGQYPDEALDRLATDKVDEVANLRLPRSVLTDEIAIALGSQSYVAQALAPARPPTYAFLGLLMASPEHARPIEGYRELVMAEAERLTDQARDQLGLAGEKNYGLYLKLLQAAWENDCSVDRSEALLLAALRRELGIWTREHLILEHHPAVRSLWATPRAFDEARNHLLATGLVLTTDTQYVIADEVARALRRAWDIELEDVPYGRLLDRLTGTQLREALAAARMPLSGSREERASRVREAMVPPSTVLEAQSIGELKDLCRDVGLSVSAAKADLIAGIVDHFDSGRDLNAQAPDSIPEQTQQPATPQPRQLEKDCFGRLLERFGLDQLYDMTMAAGLRRSGSKAERIATLVESTWSDEALLSHVRRVDLIAVARRLGIGVSGVKSDLVQRLISWAKTGPALTGKQNADVEAVIVTQLHAIRQDQPAGVSASAAQAATSLAATSPHPSSFDEIAGCFPDLGHDEQVVLALAKEARSLSEQDIERIVQRHQLGWFLTKAHMADLLARLDRTEQNPFKVRSAGGLNIYEWHGLAPSSERNVNREAARDLIDALRNGVVPDQHLDLLAVGQEAQRAHLLEQLDHVRTGKSVFKFIRAPYGGGKTFLCSWLRDQAFRREFAVSTVRIGHDQRLSDLPVFFTAAVDGLRTPEKRDASALADVLESWLLTVHRRTAQIEGMQPFDPTHQTELAELVEQRIDRDLERIAQHDPGLAPVLKAFYRARVQGDWKTARVALAWARGASSMSADGLRSLGVKGDLQPEEAFRRLAALLEIIAAGRLAGLVLLVDELELVQRFPRAHDRARAYEILRQLMDEVGENRLPHCLLIFTGTDALFEDTRFGLPSYEALAGRIRQPDLLSEHTSMRQPVIRLEGLDQDRLRDVLTRVREIHATAYGWPALNRVPDTIVGQMTAQWGGRQPRGILRDFVHVLDLCEENPSVNPEDCFQRVAQPDSAAILKVLAVDGDAN
jgi:hypothetical protein